MPPRAVCLLGPTASGKTAIAVELAQRLPVEIISVDSAMIYRGMDIGTAKPGPDILRRAPHHLIDIRDPWEAYSAGEFCRNASEVMMNVVARGRTPLLVGGTFLYFQALQKGLAPMPGRDVEVRAALDRRAEESGWPALHAELAVVDPEAAARIDPRDRQRIQRALEVHTLSGVPISTLQKQGGEVPDFEFLTVALQPGDRARLHEKIEQRFLRMLRAGFLEEVAALRSLSQVSASSPGMRAVGYRQLWEHLAGECSLEEATRRAIVATRRYAKRQRTWMRSADIGLRVDGDAPDVLGQVLEMLSRQGLQAE